MGTKLNCTLGLIVTGALVVARHTEAMADELGATCVFDNYFPLDDFGGAASQLDVAYPFYAEAASDFVLTCADRAEGGAHRLDAVQFFVWMEHFTNPEFCWDGIRITIYEDAEGFCGPNFIKGPAGEPLDVPIDGAWHIEYCPESIVCELDLPPEMADATGPLDLACLGDAVAFEAFVTDLSQFNCLLEADHKYWIAVTPVQRFNLCDQTFILISQMQVGHPDQFIFQFLGFPWTVDDGNQGGCDNPPAGTHMDFAIAVTAVPLSVPGDLNDDGVVDATDLAILLGRWGPCAGPPVECPADLDGDGEVGPADLALLLGNWEMGS